MWSSSPFQQCDTVIGLERQYVDTYAGNLYGPLNLYLTNKDTLQTYRKIVPQEIVQNLYYLIMEHSNSYENGMISYEEEERVVQLIRNRRDTGDIPFFRHIMFKYTMALYDVILKCPKQQQEVQVYRGILTHYLKEDPNNGYFLDTFTSTSTSEQLTRGFSQNNNSGVIIYHFIVTHGVSCFYIGMYEAELLLTPYQCYRFVKKEGNHYFYLIQPVSLNPPNNEIEFDRFKRNVPLMTTPMEGGKTAIKEQNHMSNYRNTRRSMNKMNNRNTKKNTEKKMTAKDHFTTRMNLPIGSLSFSIPNTSEVMAEIERVARKYHA